MALAFRRLRGLLPDDEFDLTAQNLKESEHLVSGSSGVG